MSEDLVAKIIITLKNGDVHEVLLYRRDDPVFGVDKFFNTSRIARTDVSSFACKVDTPSAITSRACEAVVSVLRPAFGL